MESQAGPASARHLETWTPLLKEPGHPLAVLEAQPLAGGRLHVLLGPTSRFGARYFAALLVNDRGIASREPVLSGLHNSGPLPSYNWIEVADTNERIALRDGSTIDIGPEGIERLFALLLDLLPPGGHLMVEYDSPARAETAVALAHGVPAIATPLGDVLFRVGFGAHFKDWQIAEGGSEGPRKLQAYKAPSAAVDQRWRQEAAADLQAFLQRPPTTASPTVQGARERAAELLTTLRR